MLHTTSQPPTRRMDTGRSEWTPSLAECVARLYGIDPLTESHWRVISECREEFARSGKVPRPAQLAALAQLSEGGLESLFPAGLVSLAWILAGVAPPPCSSATSAATLKGGAAESVTSSEANPCPPESIP